MLKTNSILRTYSPPSPVATTANNTDMIKEKTVVETQMEINAANINSATYNDKMERKGREQKAASTTNTGKNAPTTATSGTESISAQHPPHHGQRPSLAGFDPFSFNGEYAASPTKWSSGNSTRITLSPLSSIIGGTNVQTKNRGSPASNRITLKTFTSPRERRSQGSRDHSPVSEENGTRQQPSPIKHYASVESSSPSKASTTLLQKEKSVYVVSDKQVAAQTFSSGGRLLSFVRKGHRRSQSLESTMVSTKDRDTEQKSVVSEVNTKVESTKTIGIVQDLMDLKDKFVQLQIPTLAKPSPTSFLTGKGEEAVRTSYYEPSPFQIEIPSLPELVEVARLNDFVENYRRLDQNFDLEQFIGQTWHDLQNVKIKEHVPIAEALMECGDRISVQGFLSKGSNADDRLEAVVFEGQRYFIVVFRGTTEEQTKILGNSKSKRRTVPLDSEHEDVGVYFGFNDEYTKLEQACFALIDKLSEQNPFCDVVFTGYSFGAAMATLAAARYAIARPTMRVGCFTLASPKVGFSLFRHVVNSLPNLKVVRLELGQDAKCQGPTVSGWHVGHTLVLSGSFGHQMNTQKTHAAVQAYKFDTPKQKKFKTTHPDLRNYATTLEEMARLDIPWVKDFVNTAGKGVVVNNEARQVV